MPKGIRKERINVAEQIENGSLRVDLLHPLGQMVFGILRVTPDISMPALAQQLNVIGAEPRYLSEYISCITRFSKGTITLPLPSDFEKLMLANERYMAGLSLSSLNIDGSPKYEGTFNPKNFLLYELVNREYQIIQAMSQMPAFDFSVGGSSGYAAKSAEEVGLHQSESTALHRIMMHDLEMAICDPIPTYFGTRIESLPITLSISRRF